VIADDLHVFLADPDRGVSVGVVVPVPGSPHGVATPEMLDVARSAAQLAQERLG
jgi:hypothetical protein